MPDVLHGMALSTQSLLFPATAHWAGTMRPISCSPPGSETRWTAPAAVPRQQPPCLCRPVGLLLCRWHAAGRQLLKHHSVSDLLAVLQHLMDTGVTRAGLIAGHAASAGGLTLGAAINARPEWFAAAVLEAPYLDWVAGTGAVGEDGQPLVGDHLLTDHEVDEWGDPWSDPSVAELVCKMCPYTNLQCGVRYPALMLTAGLQDGRVPWWMLVKYAAKLRSMQSSKADSRGSSSSKGGGGGGASQVLLQFDEEGSHFSMGLSGGDLQDAALQQAFLLTHTV